MKIKTLALAITLTALPSLALAMGCSAGKREQQAMSCAEGTVYDSASNSCLPATT